MIVKMKKYTFLVYHQQYTDFLKQLKEQGVLHINTKPEGIAENDQLREKMQLKATLDKAIKACQQMIDEAKSNQKVALFKDTTDVSHLLEAYQTLVDKNNALTHEMANLKAEVNRMAPWGDYNSADFKKLLDAGYALKCYTCPIRKFEEDWRKDYTIVDLAQEGSNIFFVTINEPKDSALYLEPVSLSEENSTQLQAKLQDLESQYTHNKTVLKQWAFDHINGLKLFKTQVEEHIDFQKVELSTEHVADEKVMLLEGFCPEEGQIELNHFLDKAGIYYESSDPSLDDNIPVKLKNNSFAKLYEPIMNMFSLPNYNEIDITFMSAPFFMLFFGLCFGDAGYGLIIVILAFLARLKLKQAQKPYATLFMWLGGATIFAGALTGSFLGIDLGAVTWPWLAGVKHLFLTQANYGDKLGGNNPMLIISIAIGLLQIFIGMGLNVAKIKKQHGMKYAISALSWLVGLISCGMVMGLPAAGLVLPSAVSYLLYALIAVSCVGIFFYNNPEMYKKPVVGVLGNFGSGLYAAYNMATGLLGDTLSYVRLFALGLTGAILGGVFNTLAFQLGGSLNPWIAWFAILLILLIGHAINFGLCFISAFVHPIRLTFVEFYKNAGFEGGGKAYSPFKKHTL